MTKWNPRGEPTWPDWKKAKEGQRFEHVRTGATGTFVKVGNAKDRNRHAVVIWDDTGFGPRRAAVVAPAYDLRPID